jgi:nucleotide-binding universal stress UspA family protein
VNIPTPPGPSGPPTEPGRVVVGIDGTAGARRAFQWAAEEARLRDRRLVAVMAWSLLDQHQTGTDPDFDPHDGLEDAAARLDRFVAEAADGPLEIGVDRRVINDLPTRALTNAVAPQDLLVVGAGRRQGSILHFGSVSVFCATHAPCPVVVVRDTSRPRDSELKLGA